MYVMIDNYDSFTYNLVQYFGELGAEVKVYRNDAITIAQLKKLKLKKIIISPGPGRPGAAGISIDIIKQFGGIVPILGVCLGHQAIGEALGGKIVRAKSLMHGKTSLVHHDSRELFEGIENPFAATRYHSLVIEPESLPAVLERTAYTDDGEIMAIRHVEWPLWGVQFHPESILTTAGKDILANFLKLG